MILPPQQAQERNALTRRWEAVKIEVGLGRLRALAALQMLLLCLRRPGSHISNLVLSALATKSNLLLQ